LQQRIEAFEHSALQAAREIDDAAITVVKTSEQRAPLSGAVRAAERSLALANTHYQEGYADFQRVLDAQRVMFTRADREVLNQSAHIRAIIALYRAVGGGWVDMPMEMMLTTAKREAMSSRTNWGNLLSAPLPPEADTPSSEGADGP
jgi:outer membrane protein TolC